MKITPECVPCLLKRVLYETRLTDASEERSGTALRLACSVLANGYTASVDSASLATKVHQEVYAALGTNDPYHILKERSTQEALSLLPHVTAAIADAHDPLKASALCAIIGNVLDFGIEGVEMEPEMLRGVFDRLYAEGLGYDDYDALRQLLATARSVVLLTDNCGEHVFDKLFCRELKRAYPTIHLTLVVKGVPILSDATQTDVEAINFSDVVDAILTTERFAVGIPVHDLPATLKATLAGADLIIAKGMANYESLSETDLSPVAYLVRTKCRPIAASLGLPLNISALKVVERGRKKKKE